MEDSRKEILEGTNQLFLRYGIKSITMDDIARHLAMSKKTIYQYFQDKDELVAAVADMEMNGQSCKWDDIKNSSNDVIECMQRATTMMKEEFGKINPVLFLDLKKYYPNAWKRFEKFKTEFVYHSIKGMLEKGIEQGYFRKDINVDILAKMRVWQIELTFNPEVFQIGQYNPSEIAVQLFEHFIYGISTIKGHERLNQLKQITE